MRQGLAVLSVAGLLALFALLPLTAAATDCQFILGFATLKALIDAAEGPDKVGDCLENQRFNAENGDALQQTTGGLLVWRKADNWTAFTDGYRTWINGPYGLQASGLTQEQPHQQRHDADNRDTVQQCDECPRVMAHWLLRAVQVAGSSDHDDRFSCNDYIDQRSKHNQLVGWHLASLLPDRSRSPSDARPAGDLTCGWFVV